MNAIEKNTIERKLAANYWQNKIKDKEFVDYVQRKPSSVKSASIRHEDLDYFFKLTSQNEIAQFTVLLTVFGVLSQRYFDNCQFIFSRGIIGKNSDAPLLYFVESIKGKILKQCFQEIKNEVQEVYKYADYGNILPTARSFEHYTPYGFLFNNAGDEKSLTLPFIVAISKSEQTDLEISITFSENFVAASVVVHFLENLTNWIKNLDSYVMQRADGIPILSENERIKLLHQFNDTEIIGLRNVTIVNIFEEQVAKTPDNPAVIFDHKQITYRALNEQSNQVAHYITQQFNIGTGDFVGVKLERNELLVVVLLGILKSGATYVPIDIQYPQERIAYIERDSNCKLVFDADEVDRFERVQDDYPKHNLNIVIGPADLAYIIYTSGTTGKPKGVMITHANVVALIDWAQREFDASSFDIVYAATSYCFDLSVFEMFYTLSVGKKIRILNNALAIPGYVSEDKGVLINTVPSAMRHILAEGCDLSQVSNINLAGEPFPVDIAKKLLSVSKATIRNLYGPSEDTTYSTCYTLSHKEYKTIPIGKPIANTKAYIVDENKELLPIGVTGRLYLAGAGVARGYLNQPDLTAQKFIENPFCKGERMYDTGDLAKWSVNGDIEFLGRQDAQVKLRGYRIELEEIERTIASFSADIEQTVAGIKNHNNEDVLVGYFVERATISVSALRSYLEAQLPSYMVPGYLIRIKTVPLTPNGKIDKKALSAIALEGTAVAKATYVPARDKIDESLISIWEEVLGITGIGIKDHFFDLGGHSLLVSQVINKVYKTINKAIPFRTFYSNPTIEDLRQVLQEEEFIPIPRVPQAEAYAVTPSQHRLWLLSQLAGGNDAYKIAGAVSLKGNIDEALFKQAFEYVVARHEILRTFFKNSETGVLQYIMPASTFEDVVVIKDFSDEAAPQEAVARYIQLQNKVSYDLDKAPLFHAALLKVTKSEWVFFLSMHHIISDGWSLEVLRGEVLEGYHALCTQRTPIPTPLSIQYKDYAAWLKERSEQNVSQHAKEYWLKQFQNEAPVLQLPGKQRPLVKTYAGTQRVHTYPETMLSELKSFSQTHQVTLFMTLMSAVKVLLLRYSNQSDIVVGTPIAGRTHPDLEGQAGLYLNTLAIRTQKSEDDTYLSFLRKEREQLLAAYSHQDFQFEELIAQVSRKRDASRSPLFDVMVVLHNQQQLSTFNNEEITGIEIAEFEVKRNTAQFDIAFSFVERNGLSLEIEYNTDIYEAPFIQGIFLHLENLFKNILLSPTIPLDEIDFLTDADKQQLISVFNDNKRAYDISKTVVELFYEQAAETPLNTAIAVGQQSITYETLNAQSNQLAHYLIQHYSIAAGDLVAVKLERSEWLVTTLLAILKSGAAYTPIDPKYPESRIDYIVADSKAKVVIDEKFLASYFKVDHLPAHAPSVRITGSDLAYVIYTSGSTGKPKGVMIEHKSLSNLCYWHSNVYKVTETSRASLFASVAFDASVWEIYPYLLAGAAIYPIQREDTRIQLNELTSFLNRNQITHSYLPTAICQEMIEQEIALPHTTVLTGGEALRFFKKPAFNIYNNYGPTENTVVTTCYECRDFSGGNIPIGKPIHNVDAYVLSENLRLQPIGIVGELCIAGNGLARGYLNRPALTAEKFIPHPYREGGIMFRTGDLVRWLPDGNLEFIGRKDHQVKIRGNRIELGEIEHVIAAFDSNISQAVVLVNETKQEKMLVAYYATSSGVDKTKLRTFLQERLPDYMLPHYYMELAAMPLTTHGKVDKEKLPLPSDVDIIRKEFVAPRNATEEKVAAVWKVILELEQVSVTDDFFELGGHSLLLTKLMIEYQSAFRISVALKDLYINTNVAQHAALLSGASQVSFMDIEKAAEQECYALSPAQLRYWLLHQIQGKSREFNIYSTFALPADLDVEAFETSFSELVERHEVLRTIFINEKGTPKQKIIAPQQMHIPFCASEDEARATVFHHAFDLASYPLYKVALVKQQHGIVLYFNVHHIISDGWSMQIIVRDLMEIYNARISNNTPALPALPVHYKDYAQWQNAMLYAADTDTQITYWKKQLSGNLIYLQLPTDYVTNIKSVKTESAYYTVFLDAALKKNLETLSGKNGVRVFAVFVAAFKVLLHRLTSEKDIIVGIPVANRSHHQLKDMVGCFLNTLMLRSEVDENFSLHYFLRQVNATLTDALINQQCPFEHVLKQLDIPTDLNRFPISPVFLNMLDFEAKATEEIQDFAPAKGQLDAPPKFDIECYIKSFANGYVVNCVYDVSLFKEDTIQYWMDAYLSIIRQVVDNASQSIVSLEIFRGYIPKEITPIPAQDFEFFEANEIHQGIAKRFEKQAQKFPDRIAVFANEKSLTYTMLNNCANQLAQGIVKAAGDGQQRIALLLDHNETCVIGMLAVLKAGYAYVPIDVNNPLSRIKYILSDSNAKILICNAATSEKARHLQHEVPDLTVITLSQDYNIPNVPNLQKAVDPATEGYILYTSGSTGMPKGVIQNQRNILHFIRVYTNNIHIAPGDNLSVFSTYTFDASIKDIYGAILNGATVSLYDITEHGLMNLSAWLHAQGITIIHMVPTVYRHFLKGLHEGEVFKIRIVDLGGEPCYKSDFELFKKHFSEGAILINDYGPTESTIVSQKMLTHNSSVTRNNLSLGSAVIETEVFLVDEHNRERGVYQEGEIVFKSNYLALGYLNQHELTAKVFTIDPVRLEGRVYKSGDIGRMLPTGEIEFLQRKDSQVKLNGYRIELAEIRHHLEQIPDIKEAVVVLREVNETEHLIAYIRSTDELPLNTIKPFLQDRLPKHMIPDIYVPVPSFPMTRTGKIDEKALPAPTLSDLAIAPYQAPETDVERKLTGIWAEVLSVEAKEIGIEDNFFERGGHSLKVIQFLSLFEDAFQIKISFKDFFGVPTIRQQAQLVNTLKAAQQVSIPKATSQTFYPLAPQQTRLWITSQFTTGNTAYGMPVSFYLTGDLNYQVLQSTFLTIIERHEVLRTKFVVIDDEPVQRIIDATESTFAIEYLDLNQTPDQADRIAQLVDENANYAFNLEQDNHLIRVLVARLSEAKHLLLVNLHHIISDGWSMSLLVQEVKMLYNALLNNEQPTLPALKLQYKDYAVWQKGVLHEDRSKLLIDYWKNRLGNPIPEINLPFDFKRPDEVSFKGENLQFTLSEELYEKLNQIARDYDVTLFTILFSAYAVFLSKITQQNSVIVATSFSGRNNRELQYIIGFFVTTLAIRFDLLPNESFKAFAINTHKKLLEDYENSDLPFDQLLSHLEIQRRSNVSPVFQTRFVYYEDNDFDEQDNLNGIALETIPQKSQNAKFELSTNVRKLGKKVHFNFEYRSDLFRAESMLNFKNQITFLLASIVENPTQDISQLTLKEQRKNEAHKARRQEKLKSLSDLFNKV